MEVSSGKLSAGVTNVAHAASVWPASMRLSQLRILYRRSFVMVAAGFLLLAGSAVAQESRPQITPGGRKINSKEVGPRALAVMHPDAKGEAALVPIAIFVDGRFWDASESKAARFLCRLKPARCMRWKRRAA